MMWLATGIVKKQIQNFLAVASLNGPMLSLSSKKGNDLPPNRNSPLWGICGGSVCGREAAYKPTRMYLQRLPEQLTHRGASSYKKRINNKSL